jgi:hypothetical protein
MNAAAPRLHSIALNVEPSDYLVGWRPAEGILFLAALAESRVGDEVAARVGLFGQIVRATVFGSVSLVRRLGRPTLPPGVEVTLDRGSLPAARFLALAARGEDVTFRERAPRYVVDSKLVARHGGVPVEVTLRNASEGGCAMTWHGRPPVDGDEVSLRVGDGPFAAQLRGVVCWQRHTDRDRTSVGLRLVPEGRGARRWRHLLTEAVRGGGLPT